MECQSCRDFICGAVLKARDDRKITIYEKHYPVGKPETDVPKEIEREIGEDFEEALKCCWVGCHKATLTMCRRALQAACIDLGASKNKTLKEQIDQLADKRKITEPLQEQAHEVRLGGNDGAHPGKDGLHDVSKADAEEMIEFTGDFFHHVYVMPRRRAARKAAREAQKEKGKQQASGTATEGE